MAQVQRKAALVARERIKLIFKPKRMTKWCGMKILHRAVVVFSKRKSLIGENPATAYGKPDRGLLIVTEEGVFIIDRVKKRNKLKFARSSVIDLSFNKKSVAQTQFDIDVSNRNRVYNLRFEFRSKAARKKIPRLLQHFMTQVEDQHEDSFWWMR